MRDLNSDLAAAGAKNKGGGGPPPPAPLDPPLWMKDLSPAQSF